MSTVRDQDLRDIVTPALFADMDRLHGHYRYLRDNEPVAWMSPEGYRPFWAITRHADVKTVAIDNRTFRNSPRTQLFPIEAEAFITAARPDGVGIIRSIVHMDDPDHRQYRALTQSYFCSGQLTRRVLLSVQALARQTIDRLLELGRCDFVKDIALGYPLRVIMSLLGVPTADEPLMLKLTQEIFGSLDPETARATKPTDLAAVIDDFFDYFRALAAERRREPRGDLATVIAQATLSGDAIPDFEAMSYFTVIATAGHDTTSSSMAGGLLALVSNPVELAKLRVDPALMPLAVDEMIRWESPVRHFMRTAAVDYQLHGHRITAGQDVLLAYPSANRDPAAFDQPDKFLVDRKPNPHLGFGYGAHFCLGNLLAKMELKVLFDEMLARVGSIEITSRPTWTEANFIGGLKSLPIRVTAK